MWFLVLILILLFLFFSPVFKVWRAVRKFQDEYNSNMDNATRQNQGSTPKDNEQEELKERYRRYSDETGEYVSFEDVEGRPNDNESHEPQPSSGTSSKYQDEPVSDAEFEEI